MVESSNEGSSLQIKSSPRIELLTGGFSFLKVNGEMPMCSPDLTFKCLPVSP